MEEKQKEDNRAFINGMLIEAGDKLEVNEAGKTRYPFLNNINKTGGSLVVKEARKSHAEGVGEVVYFENPQNVPYFLKYFQLKEKIEHSYLKEDVEIIVEDKIDNLIPPQNEETGANDSGNETDNSDIRSSSEDSSNE